MLSVLKREMIGKHLRSCLPAILINLAQIKSYKNSLNKERKKREIMDVRYVTVGPGGENGINSCFNWQVMGS